MATLETGSMIRNISQTVQEREIVKTAPDIVVFIDGLPYLVNLFIIDARTGSQTTLVNFNDHVTSFSATYDTDAMVPNCTLQLEVPNFQKYLYQMPGGNNLLQTMAQIQVYAKSYHLANGTGDTIYRRVFKGVTSNIGYNDNGKTLEISIQCQGIMHLLEKMQVNVHPSVNSAYHAGTHLTIWQSKLSTGNCYEALAAVFLDAMRSDMFQVGSLLNALKRQNPFQQAVDRGFMAKWQAILWNMVKDVHIFGPYKDNLGDFQILVKSEVHNSPDKNTATTAASQVSTQQEKDLAATYQTYFQNIAKYAPFRNLVAFDFKNSVIVNRLDIIREITQKMDYEAYQDVDGKIIIKPPLYNLDVVDLGKRSQQSSTAPNSNSNNLTNPDTLITEGNNPFVVYLSEMLTEQENEDQAAIRRTRTTVIGNVLRSFGTDYEAFLSQVGEYIDVSKLAKFGLREEPQYQVPWIAQGDKFTLFCHAAAETARANRGYRTYTFTIPMRPELKLGFPVFIPHKDMYGYIKNISLNFNVGGTATMTVSCDSLRRRVFVNTKQTGGSGNSTQTFSAYTPAPNLIYKLTQVDKDTQLYNAVTPNPNGSPSAGQALQQQSATYAAGTITGVSNDSSNPSDPRGVPQTLATPLKNPDGTSALPSPEQLKIYATLTKNLASKLGNQFDSPFATYVVLNDGDTGQGTVDPNVGKSISVNGQTITDTNPGPGYFTNQRSADYSYVAAICGIAGAIGDASGHTNSVMPFTDGKGYEVIAPFPWGRYVDLNTAIQSFTQSGWLAATDNTDPANFQDTQTLADTDAFLFAGLGTPSATGDPSTQIQSALYNQQQRIGGNQTSPYRPAILSSSVAKGTPAQSTAQTATPNGVQQSDPQPDATIIILHYDPTQPGSFATNALLNAAQPENMFAQQLLPTNDQSAIQQVVDVLVSGTVAPSKTVQEALLSATTQTIQPQNVQLLKKITKGPTG